MSILHRTHYVKKAYEISIYAVCGNPAKGKIVDKTYDLEVRYK